MTVSFFLLFDPTLTCCSVTVRAPLFKGAPATDRQGLIRCYLMDASQEEVFEFIRQSAGMANYHVKAIPPAAPPGVEPA
jgi:hypothetical protein